MSLTRITPPICIPDLLSRTGGIRHDTRPGRRNPFRIACGVDAEGVRVAGVTFDRVTKTYADGTTAVHELNLDINDGEFMVLVGPSGCGKTTALRMVAGLEDISRGVL